MPLLTPRTKRLLAGAAVVLVAGAIYAVADEAQSSRLQAQWLAQLAGELRFKVEPGPSDAIRFPGSGPYDERLGHRAIPKFIEQLKPQGYVVTAQARMSPRLVELSDQGLFSPYREKDQAGLELRDCRSEPLFAGRFPQRIYERFESVPPLLVDALLFIENRELLAPQYPMRNPAIEWSRLGKAATDRARHLVDDAHPSPGGSTLATQIEKYRHSPEGRTESMKEKLRQMASASVRAYLDGENTLPARRRIVVEYLNTVPLSAQSGFGEVNGLGDGLWAWYGRDFAEVNRLLMTVDDTDTALVPAAILQRRALAFRHVLIVKQAHAFKQALSLMIAQRRPSHYLGDGAQSLGELTNSYLRVMAEAGLISPALRDAALPLRLQLQSQSQPPPVSFVERKAVTAARAKLSGLLEVPRAYDLDRLDLRADSSLDGSAQLAATRLLRSLKDPAAAKAAGLYGFHLLNEGDDPGKLIFSLTLFERGEHANLLRIQADNHDQPFDINEGARLDLGSTAKLRTLITYLELVTRLHERWGALSREELAALAPDRRDAIGRWAREYLSRPGRDRDLAPMLEAALERTYSANPAEGFFTGGGLHHFENFEPKDNRRVMSVREAFRHSVNLVFIRLMRDVVYHVIASAPGASAAMLEDRDDVQRRDYLARFADKEGRAFSIRFYRKYRGKSAREAEDLLLQGMRPTPARLASVFRTLEPDAGPERLAKFLEQRLGAGRVSEGELRALHERFGPDRMSLVDRGYTAGVHPLELWLVAYLRHHPAAKLADVQAASSAERQAVYGWLFKTRHKDAQDVRIRSLLEREAFVQIHRSWQRLGYPFEALTPSYASALGASGDRPAALAELMGIIVNRGLRLPAARIGSLEFARNTPYETRLAYQAPPAERVLPAEVADSVRRALLGVVESGTAQRLNRSLVRRDGTPIEIGGKTGTGDHRFDVFGRGGKLISSRVVNRSATFVFLIGERHFGTVMVYVHEPDAVKYRFTSALPAQLLKTLAPVLLPMLDGRACGPGNATGG
jgi:membrane peptidoglycan carboxypeptidase